MKEKELIRRCQQGESSDFRALVDLYKDRVYNTIFRIVGNAHDAEDIAQEAFISAYRSIGSFDINRKFAPWLLKIAANLSIDHIRKRRIQSVPLDTLEETLDYDIGSASYNEPDPLGMAEASELSQLVEQGLTKLPPNYRAAMTLYYTEELTYSEVAHVLDIPIGTVKTYLHRGREMLKTRLRAVCMS
jgi:RNA polymerase sigma-70 factor (ECF subfamily)